MIGSAVVFGLFAVGAMGVLLVVLGDLWSQTRPYIPGDDDDDG